MQWHLTYLDLPQAHRITKGAGIRIAVADSGVAPHIDLAGNLETGTDTIPGGDGKGQKDETGHGTMMAGIIAGRGHGDGAGVIGIAPEAKLLPIKITDSSGSDQGLSDAIDWTAKSGAKVLNVSIAAGQSRNLAQAVQAAIQADVVVVAGAGNKSSNPRMGQPAAISGVLAVGAVDRKGNYAEFSVTGPKLEICAPGVDIVSTDLNNKYSKGQGTSQATAIVSGAAALVRAKFPELSAPEVVHRLTATADDNGPPGRDEQCGYGVLNIVRALTADVPPLEPSGTGPSAAPTGTPSSAGASADSDTEGSPAAASPEPSGFRLPLLAGIGAAIVAAGVGLAFLIRRRRGAS